MKKIEYFETVTALFAFGTVCDSAGNEYVLCDAACRSFTPDMEITDKTAYEAVENHVHIADNVKKDEFERWCHIADVLGSLLADRLRARFPQKSFSVFVTVGLHDSVIIRFHQNWKNEPPYYDVSLPCGDGEYLAAF